MLYACCNIALYAILCSMQYCVVCNIVLYAILCCTQYCVVRNIVLHAILCCTQYCVVRNIVSYAILCCTQYCNMKEHWKGLAIAWGRIAVVGSSRWGDMLVACVVGIRGRAAALMFFCSAAMRWRAAALTKHYCYTAVARLLRCYSSKYLINLLINYIHTSKILSYDHRR